MIVSFYWHQRRPNADWLTIPILIEYNKQRLHLEIAFSFPAFFAFFFFFFFFCVCIQTNADHGFRQP